MCAPKSTLSSILRRLTFSRSAVFPHVGKWICMMPTDFCPEIANGLPRLSTIIMLARSLGLRSYFLALATIDSASRPRFASSTLWSLRKAFIDRTSGSAATTVIGALDPCTGSTAFGAGEIDTLGFEQPRIRARTIAALPAFDDFRSHPLHRSQWEI